MRKFDNREHQLEWDTLVALMAKVIGYTLKVADAFMVATPAIMTGFAEACRKHDAGEDV